MDHPIYLSMDKGMYGLVQANIISHMALKEKLLPFRYEPAPITTDLCRHNIYGVRVVDGFVIKYQQKEGTKHLIN